MRRYLIYFVIALLTFVIGNSVVFKNDYQTGSDLAVAAMQTKTVKVAEFQEMPEISLEIELTCKDKTLVPVWDI